MNTKLDLKRVEKIAKALGDPCRLKMIEMINKQRNPVQCASILDTLELAQSTVSHHLKQLVDADLLIPDKDGRCSSYQVNKEVFDAYIRFLKGYGS